MHVLEVLLEECGIISPKNGCAPEGTCGCCAILVTANPCWRASVNRNTWKALGPELSIAESRP